MITPWRALHAVLAIPTSWPCCGAGNGCSACGLMLLHSRGRSNLQLARCLEREMFARPWLTSAACPPCRTCVTARGLCMPAKWRRSSRTQGFLGEREGGCLVVLLRAEMGALARAFTLDFSHIDLWRSEEMQLVQEHQRYSLWHPSGYGLNSCAHTSAWPIWSDPTQKAQGLQTPLKSTLEPWQSVVHLLIGQASSAPPQHETEPICQNTLFHGKIRPPQWHQVRHQYLSSNACK
jgi:hypothetical protein